MRKTPTPNGRARAPAPAAPTPRRNGQARRPILNSAAPPPADPGRVRRLQVLLLAGLQVAEAAAGELSGLDLGHDPCRCVLCREGTRRRPRCETCYCHDCSALAAAADLAGFLRGPSGRYGGGRPSRWRPRPTWRDSCAWPSSKSTSTCCRRSSARPSA